MRKLTTTLALAAILAGLAPAAHATTTPLPASRGHVTTTVTATAITYSFTGLSFFGFQFQQLFGELAGPAYGTLTGVSVSATLDASTNDTFADDLALYIDLSPLSTGGLLQVGGFTSLGATERYTWATGASANAGTAVADTVTLAAPITFTGAASDPAIWLGNGYGDPDATGTWTGSITLTGLSTSPVPEPGALWLMAAGGIGIVGRLVRRRAVVG